MNDTKRVRFGYVAILAGRIGWQNLRRDDFTESGPYLVTGMHFDASGGIDWTDCFHVDEDRWAMAPEIQLREDDLLFTKDGSIGKVAHVRDLPGRASLNSHLLVIRPRNGAFVPRYAYYVLTSQLMRDYIEVEKRGTTFYGITEEAMRGFPFPARPKSDQRAIADYLDAETVRIDALIAKKRRLIEVLTERHESLLVGLLEDRGFHFPQRITDDLASSPLPPGWRVMHLSVLLDQLTNGYVGPTRDLLVDEGVRYVQSLHIKSGQIDFERHPYYVPEPWHRVRPRIHLREGDVLIVQTGDIGQIAVVPPGFGEASCHALQIARVRRDLATGPYLGAYLQSPFGRHSLLARATGALHPHLEGGIRDTQVLVPPLSTQAELIKGIEQAAKRIDKAVSMHHEQIELLVEHRQALITAAVAGDLEVAA